MGTNSFPHSAQGDLKGEKTTTRVTLNLTYLPVKRKKRKFETKIITCLAPTHLHVAWQNLLSILIY